MVDAERIERRERGGAREVKIRVDGKWMLRLRERGRVRGGGRRLAGWVLGLLHCCSIALFTLPGPPT